jgi:CPA2 family monovalent cation:H+ antiporter-2
MMLILGLLVGTGDVALGIAKIALSLLLLAALVWYLSRRARVRLPLSRILVSSPELRPLYGLSLCFGAATLTGLIGLSAAYGAFLAGLVVGNSTARNILLRSVRSVQDILIMVFFLSIGLLIDLQYVWENIGTVLLILFVVTVVKTAFNIGVLILLREPWQHAFISGVLLAQIGEFSFLLGGVGRDSGLINGTGFQLIITVTAITLIVTPLWLATARRLLRIAIARVATIEEMAARFRAGGLEAVWADCKAPPLPTPLVARVFGRPHRRSVRSSNDAAAVDSSADARPAANPPSP